MIPFNAPASDSSATDSTSLSVLRLLGTNPCTSQRELASFAGVSLGKVNYCLRSLIAKGFVKAQNYRKSRNRLAYLYLLTPTGLAAKAELARDFLARKLHEYEALRLEIERLERESRFVADAAGGVAVPVTGVRPDTSRPVQHMLMPQPRGSER
jgi:EPS-associated MarR family transcriptional regulator